MLLAPAPAGERDEHDEHDEHGAAPDRHAQVDRPGGPVRVPVVDEAAEANVRPTDDRPVVASEVVEIDWQLMVRVLGPVDVVDREGRPLAFERAKSLELVTWIAQHQAGATRTGARAALWELDIANSSFSNVVSEARRALARAVAPPAGEDWLARTYAERLPLHPAVVLDADVAAAHLARARAVTGEDSISELRAALALVRGAPYGGTSYLWPDAEALPSTLTLLATTIASELAERCLATGDTEAVFAATAVGLDVLPGHEALVALRMRAHAARRDDSGVRREFASYERAVLADAWAGDEPSSELRALRDELVGRPSSPRALDGPIARPERYDLAVAGE
jgi:two-component SAPR family response regulator